MAPPFVQVRVDKVTKHYGPTRALTNVSIDFNAGVITSVEGPNGAGKSTLLALLATLARPTRGAIHFGDLDAREDLDLIRPAIGLVAHEALVYPDLSSRESLQLCAKLYELDHREVAVRDALESAGLTEIADRPARTLSRGQLQRLSLARAQLHQPALLLFDEPTTGLDLASTARVSAAMEAARKNGRIVVLVTHDHALAQQVSDVRVFLERGRVERIEKSPAKMS